MHAPCVCLTVDVEKDCPPFLGTSRGIETGLVGLLDFLDRWGVKATFFVTGQIADLFTDLVREILLRGHELGSHSYTHPDFSKLDPNRAESEIMRSVEALSTIGPVVSFRAPYLRFPASYLHLLPAAGLRIDSSLAKYKPALYADRACAASVSRVPVSLLSSALRLPRIMVGGILGILSSPVVLLVHPWEFVDLSKESIRFDCRFRTGLPAFESLGYALTFFKKRQYSFLRISDLFPQRLSVPPSGWTSANTGENASIFR